MVLTAILILPRDLILGPSALAAELDLRDYVTRNKPDEPNFTPTCNAKLSGKIRAGDYKRFEEQFKAFMLATSREDEKLPFNSDEHRGFLALCLQSEGGDILEALKIGNLLIDHWMTVVEADERCISACALLFMKAKRRNHLYISGRRLEAAIGPGRYLHYRGTLAFHAPSLEIPTGAADKLTPALVQEYYTRAIRTIATIVFGNRTSESDESDQFNMEFIRQALSKDSGYHQSPGNDMGTRLEFIPPDLILAIVTVPPDQEFAVTTIGQALSWGIEPYGFSAPKYISERMLFVACANFVAARCIARGDETGCVQLAPRSYFSPPDVTSTTTATIDGWFNSKRTALSVQKRRLWPPPGQQSPLIVHGLTISRTYRGLCDARVIYNGGRLFAIHLQTSNSQGGGPPVGGAPFTQEDATALTESVAEGWDRERWKSRHVRLWQMLPPGVKLVDLGGMPWAELEKGGPLIR